MEHEPMPTTADNDDLQCNTNSTSIGSSVIPVINKLQDIIAPFGRELSSIPLPQIAVVGSQSSGKSSVLEALVGRDFLPRGCDICTRRPLLLMLENRPRKEKPEDDVEWGEFRHLPGLKFYDFERIRSEIQTETEREAGFNKRVSNKPIRLTISSPNVLNMTLIDLPGSTKVPVGDQPSDIEATVRKIIMSYIKHENCIILAVTPANSDLATSDALQMAIDVDPTGSRTIGVITKLDIMDRGTNALNFLLGKVVPLSLGYVGVVNRSQEDINNNRSIAEALAYEERFFHDYPVYHGLSDRCGIPQLAKKLNQILEQHIRTALPALKAELNSRLIAIVKELRTYGEVITSKAEQRAVLLTILTKYSEAFSALVDGKSQISTKELSGGARIHYIFQSIFVKSLEEVDPCEDLTDEDIRMATQNATGPRNALFGPEVLFEYLVRRQIGRLLEPSLQCVRFVNDELKEMSRASEGIEMQRFPALRRRVGEVVGKFLRDGVKPAETMIENIIEMEKDFINSSHPSFIGGSKAVELAKQEVTMSLDGTDCEREPMAEKSQNSRAVPLAKSVVNDTSLNQGNHPQSNNDKPVPAGKSYMRTLGKSIFGSRLSSFGGSSDSSFGGTVHNMEEIPSTIKLTEPLSSLRPLEMKEHERVEIIITKLLLRSYFDIVRKNIQDLVPKAIMHFLVNHTKRDLLNTFIQDIYSEDNVEEMLQEQNEIVTKRKRTREMFHVLQQAVQTLEEVESDFSSQGSSSSTGSTTKFPEIPSLLSQHDRTTKRETRTLEISSSANSRAHSID